MWEAAETWVLGEANQPVALPNDNADSDKNRIRKGQLKEGETRSSSEKGNNKKVGE